jgi:hypothetical protein
MTTENACASEQGGENSHRRIIQDPPSDRVPIEAALLVAGCSSSKPMSDRPVSLSCPQTLDELRAAPPNGVIDYSSDFTTANAACQPSVAESFSRCDGPYDVMSSGSFPACAEYIFYDHTSGAPVAVVRNKSLGGDACAGYVCVAGPPTFVVPDDRGQPLHPIDPEAGVGGVMTRRHSASRRT